jgi:hypothetical protein
MIRSAYTIVFGMLEKGEHTGESSRLRDTTKNDLTVVFCEDREWINTMTQDRAQ